MSLLTTLITSDIRMQLRLTKFVSIVMKIIFLCPTIYNKILVININETTIIVPINLFRQ
jgi:hypothetical protein